MSCKHTCAIGLLVSQLTLIRFQWSARCRCLVGGQRVSHVLYVEDLTQLDSAPGALGPFRTMPARLTLFSIHAKCFESFPLYAGNLYASALNHYL